MTGIIEALGAGERALRNMIENLGAGRRDLMDVGITDYRARRLLSATSAHPLAPAGCVKVPPLTGLPQTVALVPMGTVGRRYLAHDVYLRDEELRGQIRLRTTHLGWSDAGRIEVVRAVEQRWRIGSGAAILSTTAANRQAIAAEPDLMDNWPGAATLTELGDPIPVALDLGFAPNPTGGAAAIPGVRHVLLADLLAAARAGKTLTDVPTI